MPRSKRLTSTPQAACANPSNTKPSPIVAIKSVSSLWFNKGFNTKRSVQKPTRPIKRIVTIKARKNGSPSSIKPTKASTAKKTIAP